MRQGTNKTAEIETLRDMIVDVRSELEDLMRYPEWRKQKLSVQSRIALRQRRIEALKTAIEALSGAL
jgi:hypothetical protein